MNSTNYTSTKAMVFNYDSVREEMYFGEWKKENVPVIRILCEIKCTFWRIGVRKCSYENALRRIGKRKCSYESC